MYATHFYEWAFIIIKNSTNTGEGSPSHTTHLPSPSPSPITHYPVSDADVSDLRHGTEHAYSQKSGSIGRVRQRKPTTTRTAFWGLPRLAEQLLLFVFGTYPRDKVRHWKSPSSAVRWWKALCACASADAPKGLSSGREFESLRWPFSEQAGSAFPASWPSFWGSSWLLKSPVATSNAVVVGFSCANRSVCTVAASGCDSKQWLWLQPWLPCVGCCASGGVCLICVAPWRMLDF